MAINVDTLYTRIRTLARKDKAGYLSNSEFNAHMADAQWLLMDYYFQFWEQHKVFPEALRTFVARGILGLSGSESRAALPTDFSHLIRVDYRRATNVPGNEPIVEKIGCYPINSSELSSTLSSPIRRPSVARRHLYYRVAGGYVYVYPSDLTGSIDLEYLRVPATAVRQVTNDGTNDEENYTTTGTVHLEWDASEITNFSDIILYFLGQQIRENELIQFVSAKRGIVGQATT